LYHRITNLFFSAFVIRAKNHEKAIQENARRDLQSGLLWESDILSNPDRAGNPVDFRCLIQKTPDRDQIKSNFKSRVV
jgi:hypothetical protein